jgi:carotenoid cleavage dioxygenase-like enzyme
LTQGSSRTFKEPGWAFGEPIFAERPGSKREDDGLVLSVATHLHEERSALFVLDAATLALVVRAEVAASIPLGFHGSFRSRRGVTTSSVAADFGSAA